MILQEEIREDRWLLQMLLRDSWTLNRHTTTYYIHTYLLSM